MADVWDFGPDDPIDNAVLLWLANRCNDQGGSCFPSIAEISAKVRRSERTVTRSIHQLEADGWLVVERGSGKGIVSQYALNVDLLKRRQADTLSKPKGVSGDKQRVTATTAKGDSGDNPPHPLYGRTVKEPSGEPSGAQEARPVPPATDKLRPVNPDAGEELMTAVWFFEELEVPSDFGMRDLAAQAIRMQSRAWGGVQTAAERILKAAKDAKANGETRWRFWLTDRGYLANGKQENHEQGVGGANGTHRQSATRQRVADNRDAVRKAAERFGWASLDRPDSADGRSLSEPRPYGLDGGVPVGFPAVSHEILPPQGHGGLGRT